jgi:hypothetical protein
MRSDWRRYVKAPSQLPGLLDIGVSAHQLWNVSGIYFLCDETDLLYVGLSSNIGHRMSGHMKAGAIPATCVSYFEADRELLPFIELAYIKALDPPHNAKFTGGEWDGLDRMARLIARLWRRQRR